MRIINRRFGRECLSVQGTGATHRICIGFDNRYSQPKDKQAYPFPGKLPGFLLNKDALGGDGLPIVDWEAMKSIGDYTEQKLADAKKGQMKSGPGLLPTVLHFIIINDAKHGLGGWEYPGTYGEALECWNKSGLFCSGDGSTASRKQADGTKKTMDCVPIGRTGSEAGDFCPESVRGECKSHGRVILCLFEVDENGEPQPLSKSYGWDARYRLDTSSENFAPTALAALDSAADRTNGIIHGLTGILSYQIQKKRHAKGVGITGQVVFAILAADISDREQQLWNRHLEETKVLAIEAPKEPEGTPNPFGADEAPEPTPNAPPEPEIIDGEEITEPIKVADATDDQLAQSLSAWAGTAEAFPEKVIIHFQEEKSGNAKHFKVPNPDWFFAGQAGKNATKRHGYLRDICEGLEDEHDPDWQVLPEEEAEPC